MNLLRRRLRSKPKRIKRDVVVSMIKEERPKTWSVNREKRTKSELVSKIPVLKRVNAGEKIRKEPSMMKSLNSTRSKRQMPRIWLRKSQRAPDARSVINAAVNKTGSVRIKTQLEKSVKTLRRIRRRLTRPCSMSNIVLRRGSIDVSKGNLNPQGKRRREDVRSGKITRSVSRIRPEDLSSTVDILSQRSISELSTRMMIEVVEISIMILTLSEVILIMIHLHLQMMLVLPCMCMRKLSMHTMMSNLCITTDLTEGDIIESSRVPQVV